MGMINITDDFENVINQSNINNGIITGFAKGDVVSVTIIDYEPGLVNHDFNQALEKIAPYKDNEGNLIHYNHHDTWHDDNGSSHVKSALLSPSITIPIVDGKLELDPWQNVALIECDTKNRKREVVYQIIGD